MNRARHYRLRAQITQQQLAEMTGIQQAVISSIERRETAPRLDIARAISRALGVSLDDLWPPSLPTPNCVQEKA